VAAGRDGMMNDHDVKLVVPALCGGGGKGGGGAGRVALAVRICG
jgi:hypothetical protein